MNKISSSGSVQLSHLCNIPKIKKLKIRVNDFGDIGAQYIATSLAMRNLTLLNLSRNDIGDKGVLHLAEASFMSNLE